MFTYFDFIGDTKCICIALVRVNNLDQGICHAVALASRPCEGVLEVCLGVLDRRVTAENDKTRDTNASLVINDRSILVKLRLTIQA